MWMSRFQWPEFQSYSQLETSFFEEFWYQQKSRAHLVSRFRDSGYTVAICLTNLLASPCVSWWFCCHNIKYPHVFPPRKPTLDGMTQGIVLCLLCLHMLQLPCSKENTVVLQTNTIIPHHKPINFRQWIAFDFCWIRGCRWILLCHCFMSIFGWKWSAHKLVE